MPIFYAVYTYVSEPETYWWPLNREVPIQSAISLIWAVMIGYTLPTILMFLPWKDLNTVQNFESLWQLSPMFVPLLCNTFGSLYARKHNIVQVPRQAKQTFPDLPHLKKLYVITGALGLVLHFYCLTKILSSPDLSLASVFWPDFTPQPKALGEGLRSLFLADFWGFEVATYGWLCMAVWDLKRMGRINMDVGKASVFIALGSLIIGPGATMSAVWYWRESALAKTGFVHGLT
jgi:hypothetical protein